MEFKRIKEEKRKLEIEEAKATKKSVEKFNRMVIGKYIDFLNNGRAYDELIKLAEKDKVVTNFIDIRSSFEEDKIYRKCGKWDLDYDKIKKFYDNKVYGQHNGPDYVFSKDYVKLIEELKLDEEMNRRRI